MRNIQQQKRVFPEEEGTVSETCSVEEKERSGNHGGKKRSAGRSRKMNYCGLGGKNGNLLNVLNTRQSCRKLAVQYCVTSVPIENRTSGNEVGKFPPTHCNTHRERQQERLVQKTNKVRTLPICFCSAAHQIFNLHIKVSVSFFLFHLMLEQYFKAGELIRCKPDNC